VDWDPRPAIGVVIAAHGYPAKVRTGDAIEGLDAEVFPGVKIFHAGTRIDGDLAVTAGGRVLTVCAIGDDLADARERAYAAARRIRIEGAFCRRDIGHRALRSG
jgi:phosphoribosylamine--glycine ligase